MAHAVASSESLVGRWNNLQIANSTLPSWDVLLFKVGTRLEYRIVGKDDQVRVRGNVPYDQSDAEGIDYIRDRCEPLLEEDLQAIFSYRLVSWDCNGSRVSLLRNASSLFWQIHDPKRDTRSTLPIDMAFPTPLCSKRNCKIIRKLPEMPIEKVRKKLEKFSCVALTPSCLTMMLHTQRFITSGAFQVRYKLDIRPSGKIKISLTKNDALSAYMYNLIYAHLGNRQYKLGSLENLIPELKSRPFFTKHGRLIHICCFATNVFEKIGNGYRAKLVSHDISLSKLHLSLKFTPPTQMSVESQSLQGVAKLVTNQRHLLLEFETDDNLKLPYEGVTALELQPRVGHPSLFNNRFFVSTVEGSVTLISSEGKCFGNHAMVVVEGMATKEMVTKFRQCKGGDKLKVDSYFSAFFDFTGDKIRIVFSEEINYIERSSILLLKAEKITRLLEYVLESSLPSFSFFGADSSLQDSGSWLAGMARKFLGTPEDAHNCYTWARETMKESIGVDLGKALFGQVASLPRTITHTRTYYDLHFEKFH